MIPLIASFCHFAYKRAEKVEVSETYRTLCKNFTCHLQIILQPAKLFEKHPTIITSLCNKQVRSGAIFRNMRQSV